MRWLVYASIGLIFAVLSVFPRPYVARTKLLPQDQQSSGLTAILGSLGGGLQNFASLVGSHQTVEIYLLIARSDDVLGQVIERDKLIGRRGFHDQDQAKRALAHKVDVHSLNGGVLEIEVKDHDPKFAEKLVADYSAAIQDRVAVLSREQTAKKKAIVTERFLASSKALTMAQAALDQFRRANNLAEPQTLFGAALGIKTTLQAQIQAKQVALNTARQFATDQSIDIQTLKADIAGLQAQLAKADVGSSASESLNSLARKSIEYLNLFREARFEETLYDTYTRSLEQVEVEDAVANANQNVQILENTHIDAGRKFNILGIGGLLAVLLAVVYFEYYVPLTRLGLRRTAGV